MRVLVVYRLPPFSVYNLRRKEHCTINIHLHGHLKDCITDFGPFSFERLNGVLGSYHTNGHDISLQIMRRFLLNRGYGCNNWPQEYASDFSSHCPYTKGSLSVAEECTNQEIEALPPVAECACLPHEKNATYARIWSSRPATKFLPQSNKDGKQGFCHWF